MTDPRPPRVTRPDWRMLADRFAAAEKLNLNLDPASLAARSAADGWRVDHYETLLPSEPPGDPLADGSWSAACDVLRDYDFPDPRLITGIYVGDRPFADRKVMLLRARFLLFNFWFAVRLTDVVDEHAEAEDGRTRVWGYGYRTLNGHFEMGEISFTVQKALRTGVVSFHIDAISKPDRIRNLFYRVGFKLFGRSLQKRFARTSLERMQRFVREEIGATAERPRETVPVEELRARG